MSKEAALEYLRVRFEYCESALEYLRIYHEYWSLHSNT